MKIEANIKRAEPQDAEWIEEFTQDGTISEAQQEYRPLLGELVYLETMSLENVTPLPGFWARLLSRRVTPRTKVRLVLRRVAPVGVKQ